MNIPEEMARHLKDIKPQNSREFLSFICGWCCSLDSLISAYKEEGRSVPAIMGTFMHASIAQYREAIQTTREMEDTIDSLKKLFEDSEKPLDSAQ